MVVWKTPFRGHGLLNEFVPKAEPSDSSQGFKYVATFLCSSLNCIRIGVVFSSAVCVCVFGCVCVCVCVCVCACVVGLGTEKFRICQTIICTGAVWNRAELFAVIWNAQHSGVFFFRFSLPRFNSNDLFSESEASGIHGRHNEFERILGVSGILLG